MRHGPVVVVALATAAAGGLVYAAVNSYQQVGPVPVRAPLTLTPAPLGDLGAAEPVSPVTTQPAPVVTEEPSAEPAAVQRSTVPAPRRPARVPRTVAPATPSQVATASPTPQPTPSPVLTPSGEPTLDTGTPAPEFTVPPEDTPAPPSVDPTVSSSTDAWPQAQQ